MRLSFPPPLLVLKRHIHLILQLVSSPKNVKILVRGTQNIMFSMKGLATSTDFSEAFYK